MAARGVLGAGGEIECRVGRFWPDKLGMGRGVLLEEKEVEEDVDEVRRSGRKT